LSQEAQAAAQRPQCPVVREEQVEEVVQVVGTRNAHTEFLQKGLQVLFGRLLTMKASSIMQRVVSGWRGRVRFRCRLRPFAPIPRFSFSYRTFPFSTTSRRNQFSSSSSRRSFSGVRTSRSMGKGAGQAVRMRTAWVT